MSSRKLNDELESVNKFLIFFFLLKDIISNLTRIRKRYSLKEVAAHCTIDDCWMIVFDKVYDLTEFIHVHPAGYEIMLEYAGSDATNAFNEKPHTPDAQSALEKYFMGDLREVNMLHE